MEGVNELDIESSDIKRSKYEVIGKQLTSIYTKMLFMPYNFSIINKKYIYKYKTYFVGEQITHVCTKQE